MYLIVANLPLYLVTFPSSEPLLHLQMAQDFCERWLANMWPRESPPVRTGAASTWTTHAAWLAAKRKPLRLLRFAQRVKDTLHILLFLFSTLEEPSCLHT